MFEQGHVADGLTREQLNEDIDRRIAKLARQYEVEYAGKDEKAVDFAITRYVPPGPVTRNFITDFKRTTTAIMGPVGSGKTTAAVFKRMTAATLAPIAWHPEDGKPTRMCRWIVLRDNFRSAEKSVLESWLQWFPKTMPGSSWKGGNDRPVTHTLRFIGKDGVRIEVITEFAGLNENDVETMMRGREYSGSWLNEYDTHAAGAIDDAETRVGRYPKDDILLTVPKLERLSKTLGTRIVSGERLSSVVCDFNAPTLDSHAYQTFAVKIAETPGRAFYRQPGGLDINAENRDRLPRDYYERIAANNDPSIVMRLVHNRFGYSRHGQPVYEAFDRPRHVASQLIGFDGDVDLIIGIDMSMNTLNPAAVFVQPVSPGRLNVIDELVCDHGTGAARFSEMLREKINTRYHNARNVRLYVDPAAQYGADKEAGQLTSMEVIAQAVGLPVLVPANGSNELGLRLDAVKAELRGYMEANTSLLVCPVRCPELIAGFEGKYRFRKKGKATSSDVDDVPDKNHPHSDLHDALQYAVLGIRGLRGVRDGITGTNAEHSRGNDRGWGSQQRRGNVGFDIHKVGLPR